MRHVLISFIVAAGVGAQIPAPTNTAPDPTFDVISIKPNKSGSGSMRVGVTAGRVTAINATTLVLVQNAYSQQTFHIVGALGWMDSERYDVVATITPPVQPTPAQYQAMMRKMLADRFSFVVHLETREMPAYVLTRARPDGKLGPRLWPWNVDCRAVWSGEIKPPPSSVPGIPPCGGRGGGGFYAQSGVSMDGFARSLASNLGATVINQTGLKGEWEIHLQWAQETQRADAAQSEFGSLFTSVQEQLGLKLEARRLPVEVLVIDNVERPSEN